MDLAGDELVLDVGCGTVGNLGITHDSLIRKIPFFGNSLLEESGFHIQKRMEMSKGITIIVAKKGSDMLQLSL